MSQVGETRQFSFTTASCTIREIIENCNISMWWLWKEEVCPHCHERIEKRTLHTFNRIEVLLPEKIKNEQARKEDFIFLGFANDGKIMHMTIEKYDEILKHSQKFKHLVSEIKDGM